MEQSNSDYFECQKGEETGKVPLSPLKVIIPLAEYLKSRQKMSAQFYEALYVMCQ